MARKSGCGSILVALVVVAAVAFAFTTLADRLDKWRFPWGYADSGRPTLIGTWVGPIRTGSGRRVTMLVDIQLVPLDHRRRRRGSFRTRLSRWLGGDALVCAGPGIVKRFTLRGAPDDERAASRFHLAVTPADSVRADGLAPSHIGGRWSGGDSISVAVTFVMRRGTSVAHGGPDPDMNTDAPGTLRRATQAEFNSLCSGGR